MKSGWQMEWDVQLRYAAPLRSHFQAMAQATRSFRVVLKAVTEGFERSAKSFQKLIEALDQKEKPCPRPPG